MFRFSKKTQNVWDFSKNVWEFQKLFTLLKKNQKNIVSNIVKIYFPFFFPYLFTNLKNVQFLVKECSHFLKMFANLEKCSHFQICLDFFKIVATVTVRYIDGVVVQVRYSASAPPARFACVADRQAVCPM